MKMETSKSSSTGPDADDEGWETDEEILIHLELSGIIQSGPEKTGEPIKAKFIGLETERPIAQIGSQVFSGKFEDPIGSSVFFKTKEIQPTDTVEGIQVQPTKEVTYMCKTDKRLVLQRVFLNPQKVNSEKDDSSAME